MCVRVVKCSFLILFSLHTYLLRFSLLFIFCCLAFAKNTRLLCFLLLFQFLLLRSGLSCSLQNSLPNELCKQACMGEAHGEREKIIASDSILAFRFRSRMKVGQIWLANTFFCFAIAACEGNKNIFVDLDIDGGFKVSSLAYGGDHRDALNYFLKNYYLKKFCLQFCIFC